jgi:hypothetical protein
VTEWSISHETKKTHRHKGCGWLAPRRGSKYQKTHIIAKYVVGLLLGEVVSTKKKNIVAKDVVGLQVGDSKNDSLTKMKTY